MNRYYYDLHIHSCLSPCADNDMTPNDICGMGVLNGLDIMALTDHNSAKNCPAFCAAAKRLGIIPIPGMELTTSEEIHAVCLFETLEDALRFDSFVDTKRFKIPNMVPIFGDQLIRNEKDEIIGREDYLLSNAADISIDDVFDIAANYNGVSFPAHIDRQSNGIIQVLGTFPKNSKFRTVEFANPDNIDEYIKKYPELKGRKIIVSSDAHVLWNIKEKKEYFEFDDKDLSSDSVRKKVIDYLRT